MEDLRRQYNKSDREQAQRDIIDLRCYILPLLLKRQDNKCNMCRNEVLEYDIDHIVYNPKITINELQALCISCHKSITNYVPFRNRSSYNAI
jgi:hypothetical protein